MECETLVKNMQNLKQKEDLDGTRRPRCPKPLFAGANTFMKVATKGDATFIYVLPSPKLDPCFNVKFLPKTKNSRICLRRKMQTPCLSIDHMTAPLILWKRCNLHLDPSIIVTRRTCNAS
jgi:hypothetical protein